MALLESLESAGDPTFKQEIQNGLNRWWLEDCERNAEMMKEFFYRKNKHLGATKEGTFVHSLPLYADKPFELIGGQVKGQMGEWPIQGYGDRDFHLYWLAERDIACVIQRVKWDDWSKGVGWSFYGDLQFQFHYFSALSSPVVVVRLIFTAESLISTSDERIKGWAEAIATPKGAKFVDDRWKVKEISVPLEELRDRLGLTISEERVNQRKLMRLIDKVRFVVSRLDYRFKDNWQEIYSRGQKASARVRRFS